jgi:PKD repeat protein
MRTLILFIGAVLILVSCKKENSLAKVNSDFSLGDTLLKVNENLVIKNLSDSISVSYKWDFGDGLSSYDKNPTHCYLKPGKYAVKLLVSNNSGISDSTSINIRVGISYVYEIVINSLDQNTGYPDFHVWDQGTTEEEASPDVFIRINEYNGSTLFESETINNIDFKSLPLSIEVPNVKIHFETNEGVETEISINDKDDSVSEQIVSNLWSGANRTSNIYDHVSHTGVFNYGFYDNSYTVKYKIN